MISELPNIQDVAGQSFIRGQSFDATDLPPNVSESTSGGASVTDSNGGREFLTGATAGDTARLTGPSFRRIDAASDMLLFVDIYWRATGDTDTPNANEAFLGAYRDDVQHVGFDLINETVVVDGTIESIGIANSGARPAISRFVMDNANNETRFVHTDRAAGTVEKTISDTSALDASSADFLNLEAGDGEEIGLILHNVAYGVLL